MKTLLTIVLPLLMMANIMAKPHKTFIYEITLFDQYKHQSMWTEKEHEIQKEHIAYLDSLTKAGSLQLAGIADQGLAQHTGFIVLTTDSYKEAKNIALNDPSVKGGMMSVSLRPITIYFKQK